MRIYCTLKSEMQNQVIKLIFTRELHDKKLKDCAKHKHKRKTRVKLKLCCMSNCESTNGFKSEK